MKTSHSYSYWQRRQDERLTYSEKVSNQTVSNIADVYDDSLARVEKRIDRIISNYAKSVKMPADALKERLDSHNLNQLLQELTDDLIKNGANTNKNMQWLQGNYLKRLSDQEAIKLQLENERRIITHNERKISEIGYNKTIDETYKSMVKDLVGSTKGISPSAKESMLSKRWVAGRNYSDRVWDNTGKLSTEVDKLINSSLLSGAPKYEIINELAERYEVAKYRAETLVRTEMNYFENQTELQSYKDLGVTHYTYLATRDNRTSTTCADLDGTRHAVKDSVPGKNYPPMHPNCRSGTIPDLDFENDYRVYKDPVTRKRETTSKLYDEWYESKRQSYDKGPKAYDIEIKKLNNLTQDDRQYKKYIRRLGYEELPKTVHKFQDMKYNDSSKWNSLKHDYKLKGYYDKSINNSGLSALADFELYKETNRVIYEDLHGIITNTDIEVKSHSYHFINRVIGSLDDKRSGVEVKDIKYALQYGEAVKRKNSIKYVTDKCEVSINQYTRNLIQVNPVSRKKR